MTAVGPMTWDADTAPTIVVGGATLEAACHGPAPVDAPTLVLLHEGLGCIAMWRDFPKKLAAATGCGVFVYSRAGYGASDPCDLPRPIDYMTREAVDVLPAVLDLAGIDKAVLVGHSDGATIAAIYAGSVQDRRVRGLVLMAPHFFVERQGYDAIAATTKAYEAGPLREKLARHHRNVDVTFRGWSGAWLRPDFGDWNVEDVIAFIRVPILAIQGDADAYGTWAQIDALETQVHCPLDVARLDGCGHAPFLEQPDATLALVRDFTARLEADRGGGVTVVISDWPWPAVAFRPGVTSRPAEDDPIYAVAAERADPHGSGTLARQSPVPLRSRPAQLRLLLGSARDVGAGVGACAAERARARVAARAHPAHQRMSQDGTWQRESVRTARDACRRAFLRSARRRRAGADGARTRGVCGGSQGN